MVADERSKTPRVKASLRRLSGLDEATVIRRGAEATHDLDSAARFVDTIGIDQLKAAVDATDDAELTSLGRRTVERFQRFRRAAAGEHRTTNHFHRGRGTDLRCDGEGLPQ